MAEENFKKAAEAYEILSDPNKKAKYDQYGHQAFDGNGGGKSVPAGAAATRDKEGGECCYYSKETISVPVTTLTSCVLLCATRQDRSLTLYFTLTSTPSVYFQPNVKKNNNNNNNINNNSNNTMHSWTWR